MPRMKMHHIAPACLILAVLLHGCTQGRNSTSPGAGLGLEKTATGARERANQCPMSHQQLGMNPANRWFGGHAVLFLTEAQASSFDELPGEQKRVKAARQVMARRGVANEACLVNSRALPIDAVVVAFNDVPIGFSNQVAFHQFQQVPADVQEVILAPYLVRASGVSNIRCPITGEPLQVGCPTISSSEIEIGFLDQEALEDFKGSNPDVRNEIKAGVILPSRGVSNTMCPITNRPLRLDSPIIEVNGQLIGIRNVDAARTFNKLNKLQQQKLLVQTNLLEAKENSK